MQRGNLRFVFYVGDQISPLNKTKNPSYVRGGVIRPHNTLKHCTGFIRQCEITPLKQYMWSETAQFIHPEQRAHMIASYNIVEGDVTTTVGNDGLLRTAFYPEDELPLITGQNDGIVEMPIQPGNRWRIQRFLFPNWDAIEAGQAILPQTIAAMKAHFTERLAAASDPQEFAAATAALASCDSYIAWGQEVLGRQSAQLDEAKAKGWAWTYAPEAEMLFAQLGMVRKDNLAQEQTTKFDTLAEATANLAKAMEQMVAAQQVGRTQDSFKPEVIEQVKQVVEPIQEVVAQVQPVQEPAPVEEIAEESADVEIKVGDAVTYEEEVVKVVGKPFGKLKIEYSDGKQKTVEKSSVTVITDAD